MGVNCSVPCVLARLETVWQSSVLCPLWSLSSIQLSANYSITNLSAGVLPENKTERQAEKQLKKRSVCILNHFLGKRTIVTPGACNVGEAVCNDAYKHDKTQNRTNGKCITLLGAIMVNNQNILYIVSMFQF